MNKTTYILCALTFLTFSFTSCNRYHSVSHARNVRQLSANPFLSKVARSVIRNISDNIIAKGLTSFKGKPLLRSSLGSLLNTTQSVSAFKNSISTTYGISQGKVNNSYGQWNTVRDVINFVAKNGKKYDFNSYSNRLF